MTNFDMFQKQAKENMEMATKSFEAFTSGMQVIGKETADFSKKSFDDSKAAFEKVTASKSPETAIAAQTDFAKSSYEGFVAQATKMGELYADIAKNSYKPFENVMPKAGK